MEKPIKKSKYQGIEEINFKNYVNDLDRDIFNMFQYTANKSPYITQDTATGKVYVTISLNGVEKKAELL